MSRRRFAVRSFVTLALAGLLALTTLAPTAQASAPTDAPAASAVVHTCSTSPRPGHAACFAELLTGPSRSAYLAHVRPKHRKHRKHRKQPAANRRPTLPSGYGPADLRSAYRLPATAGSGRTVAVIDAYDDPSAEHDLAVYRATYHLPPCTSANDCFRKVNQRGGSQLPAGNASWAVETSLDLDMVSATCPRCTILLVEADSDAFTDLGAAVDYAATQHVTAISNSYGGPDSAPDPDYDHPGIAITAATGDHGYSVSSPASYDSVIAVGGTSLHRAATARGWTESAWGGSGSGCSTQNAKPSWQGSVTQCSGKTTADVAAVADPHTGVAAYDSTPFDGYHGWLVLGGTSAAAPIIAAVYALSGNTSGYPAAWTWAHRSGLNDVTSGSNGACPAATRLWCTSRSGWDGPTGLGTPDGTSAF